MRKHSNIHLSRQLNGLQLNTQVNIQHYFALTTEQKRSTIRETLILLSPARSLILYNSQRIRVAHRGSRRYGYSLFFRPSVKFSNTLYTLITHQLISEDVYKRQHIVCVCVCARATPTNHARAYYLAVSPLLNLIQPVCKLN